LFTTGQPPGSGSVLLTALQESDNKFACGTKVTIQAVPSDGWVIDAKMEVAALRQAQGERIS